ncbi:MAG: T9SS type A sorting domain-containing protein [Marinilabiliaceae bacterium]|nr:T9SS type A sorting domain-containing protein [Marinilabiliaceae bacterium]
MFLTFQQAGRNQKVVQDATGGILIDDDGAKITTVYVLNDGIAGLIGALSEFRGLLQFIPAMDPGAATSNGNVVSATELTISDLIDNWSSYESKLVKLSNVSFGAKAGDKFADGQNYTLTDKGANEIVLRTNFQGTDLVDNVIPASATVVGVAAIYDGAHQIIPRGSADISVVTTAVSDMVKQQMAISPNPFQNTIKIASESNVVSVAFYNSVGQLVKEVYNVDSSIPTGELAKGLYIIQVTFEDGSVSTQKVTKK